MKCNKTLDESGYTSQTATPPFAVKTAE